MQIVKLKIGQKKPRPPEFVDKALVEIGHNSGRVSPLVAMSVDPDHRPAVQAMAYDAAWQMCHATDDVVSDKWLACARTIGTILRYTKRAHAARRARK